MTMSMTGFGRARIEEQGMDLTVEIKTLNHRYLDINLRLPRNMSFLEEELRGIIQDNIKRGRVEVYISYTNQANDTQDVEANQPLLTAYLSCFDNLVKTYNIKNDLCLSHIVNIPDLFMIVEKGQDEERLKTMVTRAVVDALEIVKEMRAKEGAKLKGDILNRAEMIAEMVGRVEERAPLVVEEYRKKLKTRITDLLQSADLDENRFNTEVAYFADRSNITEEIVRLGSHLEQLKGILDQQGPVGRKLDFLIQEMNREANTIGSKAGDLTIINLVVDIKSEIEKIREQIQNIE